MTKIDLDLPGRPEDTRVVVAMSGGVDSSVAAALVKEAGYETIGITLQLYDHGVAVQKKGACCAGQDIHDARRVSAQLGIPHYVLNYEDRFKSSVMDSFAQSYVDGETPIPCVACNQTVKFTDLLETAKDLGAAALVTGHYITSRVEGNRRALYRPSDGDKDQSYFLFATTQEQLDFVRFPLGQLTKAETRAIAEKYSLITADKPESQDICFVPSGKYSSVVEKLRPGAAEPGQIVHLDGRVLGEHKGIIHYTIGQRRGIGVAVGDPLYVVGLDPDLRRVYVGPREALLTRALKLRDVNWIGPGGAEDAGETGLEVFVKVRSTSPPKAARFFFRDGEPFVELDEGEDGIAAGQACVLYENGSGTSRVFGGGFIASAERDAKLQMKALSNA